MATMLSLLTAQVSSQGPSVAEWAEFENIWVVGLVYMGLVGVGLVVDGFLLVRLLRKSVPWARHTSRLNWRPWTVGEALRIVVLLLVLHGAGMYAYRLMNAYSTVPEDGGVAVVLQSIVFHWAGLALVIGSLRRRGLSWKSAFGLDARKVGRDVGLGVIFYLGVIPILWFYSLLYQAGLKYVGYEPRLQEVAWALTVERPIWLRIYLLSLAIAIAPVLEELLFRGVGLPLIAKRMGTAKAVFIVSVVFALIHFHLPSIVPLFVIAVAFSLAYLYSESILVPAVMHALFNAVNISLLLALKAP